MCSSFSPLTSHPLWSSLPVLLTGLLQHVNKERRHVVRLQLQSHLIVTGPFLHFLWFAEKHLTRRPAHFESMMC